MYNKSFLHMYFFKWAYYNPGIIAHIKKGFYCVKTLTNKLSREERGILINHKHIKLSRFKEDGSLNVEELALALWVVVPKK